MGPGLKNPKTGFLTTRLIEQSDPGLDWCAYGNLSENLASLYSVS